MVLPPSRPAFLYSKKRPMESPSSSSWSDIPVDLVELVLGRLGALVDRVRFAAVCPQWRTAARDVLPPPPPLPLLLLRDGTAYSFPSSDPRRFPAWAGYVGASGNRLLFSSKGGCFLRDPLTNADDIPLPALSRFLCRDTSGEVFHTMFYTMATALTVTKLLLCSKTRVVAALVKIGRCAYLRIAVCKPGGPWWSVCTTSSGRCASQWTEQHADIAFHEGELFVVHAGSTDLCAIDVGVDRWTGQPWVSGVRRVIGNTVDYSPWWPWMLLGWPDLMRMVYLVESPCGALLMVHRRNHLVVDEAPKSSWCCFVGSGCSRFEVFKADLETAQWTRVTSIGDDQVLFLSRRQCRSVCVSQFGMPGDRIVFFENDDDQNIEWDDMDRPCSCTVYDVRDGKLSYPLPGVSWDRAEVPATWLFPQN